MSGKSQDGNASRFYYEPFRQSNQVRLWRIYMQDKAEKTISHWMNRLARLLCGSAVYSVYPIYSVCSAGPLRGSEKAGDEGPGCTDKRRSGSWFVASD